MRNKHRNALLGSRPLRCRVHVVLQLIVVRVVLGSVLFFNSLSLHYSLDQIHTLIVVELYHHSL